MPTALVLKGLIRRECERSDYANLAILDYKKHHYSIPSLLLLSIFFA